MIFFGLSHPFLVPELSSVPTSAHTNSRLLRFLVSVITGQKWVKTPKLALTDISCLKLLVSTNPHSSNN